MKANLGCGLAYMEGWVNVDQMRLVRADVYASLEDFIAEHGAEIEEAYMGHVLEHMLPGDGFSVLRRLVDHCRPRTVVSAVVPDMSAIHDAYRSGEIDNWTYNFRYVHSYEQPSHHRWSYDGGALEELFTAAGFERVRLVDPLTWPPVWWKEGPESRWQCGVCGVVPERPAAVAEDERWASLTTERLEEMDRPGLESRREPEPEPEPEPESEPEPEPPPADPEPRGLAGVLRRLSRRR
jgi:predicted SAM-dependent methyltransferase